ncbi:MAG: hypothetical protein FWF35_04000 [Elusimicrobia bacterium]|nr:hypothetical protein [Elusimicrobiota bacterium]
MKRMGVLFIGVLIWLAVKAPAQELGIMGGILNKPDYARSYAWKINYYDVISDNYLWSFSWYNEGHITDNHRDGMLLQAWYRMPVAPDKFYIGLGAGPFYFFDTTGNDIAYKNIHGFALALGLDLWYYLSPRWALKGNITYIVADNANTNTQSALAGISYKFKDLNDSRGPYINYADSNEVNLFLGKTILNSFHTHTNYAAMAEYRRNVGKYMDLSAALLYEGDTSVLRRNGVIIQAWPTKRFDGGRFSLGVGLGAYVTINRRELDVDDISPSSDIAGIVTMTGAYRFSGTPLTLRASWNRIVTTYDKDTDVIMAGLGVYF